MQISSKTDILTKPKSNKSNQKNEIISESESEDIDMDFDNEVLNGLDMYAHNQISSTNPNNQQCNQQIPIININSSVLFFFVQNTRSLNFVCNKNIFFFCVQSSLNLRKVLAQSPSTRDQPVNMLDCL